MIMKRVRVWHSPRSMYIDSSTVTHRIVHVVCVVFIECNICYLFVILNIYYYICADEKRGVCEKFFLWACVFVSLNLTSCHQLFS